MFSKQKLIFDPSAVDEMDNVGAYLRSSDGTLLTHTQIGAKEALDVNIANASVTVSATDLDIRDLDAAQDNVAISDGTDTLAVNADGSINITDNGASLTVDATDLDIRNLTQTDEITVFQGTSPWVVSATDLDIRDLTHVTDSVKIGDGTDFLAINADGSINVNADIDVVSGAEKAEDSAHASGDVGQYVLAVRQDTLANSVSTDGDYASFKVNSLGALYVEVAKNAVASHTSWLVSQNSVGTSAELIVAADLTNRKKIIIQNLSVQPNVSSKAIYLGHSNAVTSANGLKLPVGEAVELELAAGVAIYAISGVASADIRVAELAG